MMIPIYFIKYYALNISISNRMIVSEIIDKFEKW